jgi:ketosteroid isomerase-like protein
LVSGPIWAFRKDGDDGRPARRARAVPVAGEVVMKHSETVGRIYAAFRRGDIAGILGDLADDVEWEYSIEPMGVPWLDRRRGRSEVSGFFAAMANFELHQFEPKVFLENGNVVVVLIDVALTVKATGKRVVEEDEVHIWYFDQQGRVTRFGHKVDSHQHWIACGRPA